MLIAKNDLHTDNPTVYDKETLVLYFIYKRKEKWTN